MNNKSVLSLYQLNNLIKNTLNSAFDNLFWIQAETSDVRHNQNGHCYLELIDKNPKNENIIAKTRANIWSNVFRLLKAYFESETNQTFTSGIKVLVQVSIEFHELYGYSLTIHDIDPTYTLGDQAKKKQQIIKQLEDEGVINLNKEIELPQIIKRIAIISSATAAGYEDFCNQLTNNNQGFSFYTKLFSTIMQGETAESSIINSLERIYENIDKFDIVTIIRGGGSTSDLNCFDSYLLATNCAQFPLPIITGIGHERDESIVDIVANTRAKTPTACAEFIISKNQKALNKIDSIQLSIINIASNQIGEETFRVQNLQTKFNYLVKDSSKEQLKKLELMSNKLKNASGTFLQKQQHKLESVEQYIDLVSPNNILKKGYSMTLHQGKIIRDKSILKNGDEVTTILENGQFNSIVKE